MSKKKNYKRNQIKGGWKLQSKLGIGGNGEVWLVTKNDEDGAIKLLKRIRTNIYLRFKAEVHAITQNQDIDGIIGIKDSYLPDDISKTVPWFVMPVASKFTDWRKDKDVLTIVKEMYQLAITLKELHARSFYHRDIKPANILFVNERLNFSDFGLVKYPGKDDVTEKGTDIGPKFTMAPEMRRYANDADGEYADVYLLR